MSFLMLFCHPSTKQLLDLETLHLCSHVHLRSPMILGACPIHPHFLLEQYHCVCCGKPVSSDVTRSIYEMGAIKVGLKSAYFEGRGYQDG